MPVVRIRRDSNPNSDRGRQYRVLVDDREAGSVKWGQTIDLPVEPGEHRLRLKIDWTGSPTIPFNVSEGEVAEFLCRPRRSAALAIVSVIRSIGHRDDWLALERV